MLLTDFISLFSVSFLTEDLYVIFKNWCVGLCHRERSAHWQKACSVVARNLECGHETPKALKGVERAEECPLPCECRLKRTSQVSPTSLWIWMNLQIGPYKNWGDASPFLLWLHHTANRTILQSSDIRAHSRLVWLQETKSGWAAHFCTSTT